MEMKQLEHVGTVKRLETWISPKVDAAQPKLKIVIRFFFEMVMVKISCPILKDEKLQNLDVPLTFGSENGVELYTL